MVLTALTAEEMTLSSFAPNRVAKSNLPLADLATEEPLYLGLPLSSWVKVATLGLLFALLFWPNLRRLWEKTNPIYGEDNWKHGCFVPLIGLYYLYVNREALWSAKIKTAWSGLIITLAGVLFFAYAIWPGQNDWFKDMGMVLTLFGLVTFMCGWRVMRTVWFPIAFLVAALPWPGLFYSMLAGPLQKFAAQVAVKVLVVLGVNAGQFGTKIFVEGKDHLIRTLNVEEACAGLRSLMTFIAIAGAIAFLSFRPLWQKIIMVFSAIPIAIFCNTMRITVQGMLEGYGNHLWAEGFAHGFLGLTMMITAFPLIILVGWVLQNILIEEVTDKKALRGGGGGTGGRRVPAPVGPRAIPAAKVASRRPADAGGLATAGAVAPARRWAARPWRRSGRSTPA